MSRHVEDIMAVWAGRAAEVPRVSPSCRRGFSLTELVVVLGVTVILTSLLFPAFRSVRENAHRLACASNQRQIGAAVILFATDHDDRLPESTFASGPNCQPQEMMACTLGGTPSTSAYAPLGPWEGLGWLVAPAGGRYLDSPQSLYCPSHRGQHPYERYADSFDAPGPDRIYSNYQYIGDRSLSALPSSPRKLANSHAEVLVTDGLRTQSDYNHQVGGNVLHGDCAVTWYQDVNGAVRNSLPLGELAPGDAQAQKYTGIWKQITGAALDEPPALK